MQRATSLKLVAATANKFPGGRNTSWLADNEIGDLFFDTVNLNQLALLGRIPVGADRW